MSILLNVLYWALGIYLTAFAGRTTYFSDAHAILLERPINALLIVGIWVFLAYKYMQYCQANA